MMDVLFSLSCQLEFQRIVRSVTKQLQSQLQMPIPLD